MLTPEAKPAVTRDGVRLVLQTGPRAVRQIRRRVQTAGVMAALAGLALAWLNPWALVFTALALLALVLVPRRLRACRWSRSAPGGAC